MKLEAIRIRVRTWLVVVSLIITSATLPSIAAEQIYPANPQADGSTAVARARVAADVLMSSYDPNKAWFPSSWWNSAVALQTIGDYMQRTGDRRYLGQLDNTFEKTKAYFLPAYCQEIPCWATSPAEPSMIPSGGALHGCKPMT